MRSYGSQQALSYLRKQGLLRFKIMTLAHFLSNLIESELVMGISTPTSKFATIR